MDHQSLQILFSKYLAGDVSQQELELLLEHFDVRENSAQLRILVERELSHEPTQDWEERPEVKAVFDRVENRLIENIRKEKRAPVPLWDKYYKLVGVAAAILLLVGLGYLFRDTQPKPPIAAGITANDALPGSDKATLTLADGEVIELGPATQTNVTDKGGVLIGKVEGGTMAYKETELESENQLATFHTIATPKGGQYALILSDGTKVWLNAGSSLRYPATFTGRDREVTLTGEGYFEVAKAQGKPFLVKTDKQTVEVLGTHFNINAYSNEDATKTTLLEGSVRISLQNTPAVRILKPGQQSASSQNITVKEIDIERAVAWKQGQFNFQDMTLREVMRQLERWYDVEVDYTGMPDIEFVGSVPRDAKLSSVLKALEITSNVKFKIEERRISMAK